MFYFCIRVYAFVIYFVIIYAVGLPGPLVVRGAGWWRGFFPPGH